MNPISKALLSAALLFLCSACNSPASQAQRQKPDPGVRQVSLDAPQGRALAAFAEGCFWCVEEVFEAVQGVDSAVSGYAGGTTPNPTYQTVGGGRTDHAEAVLVYYDPQVVSYDELLNVFFTSHDPTTLHRQGPDAGPQYRSIAFYRTAAEKSGAERAKSALEAAKTFKKPIVSEIQPLTAFYRAEDYHQDYTRHHPDDGYVRQVSVPRFERFKRTYRGKLKAAEAH
jgi:peptide-methionine (S)-S-oxide reductase